MKGSHRRKSHCTFSVQSASRMADLQSTRQADARMRAMLAHSVGTISLTARGAAVQQWPNTTLRTIILYRIVPYLWGEKVRIDSIISNKYSDCYMRHPCWSERESSVTPIQPHQGWFRCCQDIPWQTPARRPPPLGPSKLQTPDSPTCRAARLPSLPLRLRLRHRAPPPPSPPPGPPPAGPSPAR